MSPLGPPHLDVITKTFESYYLPDPAGPIMIVIIVAAPKASRVRGPPRRVAVPVYLYVQYTYILWGRFCVIMRSGHPGDYGGAPKISPALGWRLSVDPSGPSGNIKKEEEALFIIIYDDPPRRRFLIHGPGKYFGKNVL